MSELGAHSEVGKLRKVMVHRPGLELQRLTPTNHDDLLFDDVLWVERAQWEHDQFVARMRERGVEVFLLVDLLTEAADSGKQVAVLLELKARFDERNNINWATRLESAGIHVVYGLLNVIGTIAVLKYFRYGGLGDTGEEREESR